MFPYFIVFLNTLTLFGNNAFACDFICLLWCIYLNLLSWFNWFICFTRLNLLSRFNWMSWISSSQSIQLIQFNWLCCFDWITRVDSAGSLELIQLNQLSWFDWIICFKFILLFHPRKGSVYNHSISWNWNQVLQQKVRQYK